MSSFFFFFDRSEPGGCGSGINNAVSRCGLLAIAVMGRVFATVFNRRLELGLDALGLHERSDMRSRAQRGENWRRTAMSAGPAVIRDCFSVAIECVLWCVGPLGGERSERCGLIEARPQASRVG